MHCFIQTPYVWGGIASIGQRVWGQSPQKLEAFCCISSLFLSILEGKVWFCSSGSVHNGVDAVSSHDGLKVPHTLWPAAR